MKLKVFTLTIIMTSLAACTQVTPLKSGIQPSYASPKELIVKKNLNNEDGSAKQYIYIWDAQQKDNPPQSLIPRTAVSQYCHAQNGTLVLAYKSQLSLVKSATQKQRLMANKSLAQGIGAYKCKFKDGTDWLVSIEPISEQQLQKDSATRSVKLLSKVVTMTEARQFYRSTPSLDKKNEASKATKTSQKDAAKKEATLKDVSKESPVKDVKPTVADVVTPTVLPNSNAGETTQQQQARLYVASRRDINAGKNVDNACNNAQKAYGFGKLQGTEGTRVYTESGMLVARCLNNIPSYGSRIPNAKGQAKRILTNLATNYNHSGAKNMLRQMK